MNQKLTEPCKIECINGIDIVMMSPPFSNHNTVKENIFGIFYLYLRGNICLPKGDNSKLVLCDDSYVIPDFFVVCDRSVIRKDGIYGVPPLIVEVLSPITAKYDKGDKKELYQRCGVKEYWLIEPDLRQIEVYILEKSVYLLDNLYRFPDELESEEDKSVAIAQFTSFVFPNLLIQLEDVFQNVIDW